MNVKLIVIIMIIISLLNLGCHYSSSIGPTYNIDRPVMLGKVQRIGDATKQRGIKINDFDISHYYGTWNACVLNYCFGHPDFVLRDSVDADDELKKKVVAPDNLIKVDKVHFSSLFLVISVILITPYAGIHSTTGIQGGVYEVKSVNQAEDSAKTMRDSGEKR